MTPLEAFVVVGFVLGLVLCAFWSGAYWEGRRWEAWVQEDGYDRFDALQADCDAWAEGQGDDGAGG